MTHLTVTIEPSVAGSAGRAPLSVRSANSAADGFLFLRAERAGLSFEGYPCFTSLPGVFSRVFPSTPMNLELILKEVYFCQGITRLHFPGALVLGSACYLPGSIAFPARIRAYRCRQFDSQNHNKAQSSKLNPEGTGESSNAHRTVLACEAPRKTGPWKPVAVFDGYLSSEVREKCRNRLPAPSGVSRRNPAKTVGYAQVCLRLCRRTVINGRRQGTNFCRAAGAFGVSRKHVTVRDTLRRLPRSCGVNPCSS